MTQADANTIKQQQRKDWGDAAPAWRKTYDRFRETTAPVTNRMLELAGIGPGMRVLDIACGSGEPAIPAALLVGPSGSVLATDMAPEMVAVARDNAVARGVTNIEFRLVDGEEIDAEPASFDAVTCRWGIMFMPEPVRCLAQARVALKPGGRAVVATWGPPPRNPFLALPMMIARKYYEGPPLPDATAPGGVFSFSDHSRLESVFTEAGFRDVGTTEMELPMSIFDSGRDYWEYCREFLGPLRRILGGMPPDVQETIGRDVAEATPQGNPGGNVSLTGNPLLASATK